MRTRLIRPVGALVLLLAIAACSVGGLGGAAATTEPPPTEAPPTDIPATEAPPTATVEVPTENVLRFQNAGEEGEGRLSIAEFDLRLLPPAPENVAYFAWLLADDGTPVLMGTVEGGAVASLADAEGRNLLALYSGAQVSLETAGSEPTAPTLITLNGALPASLLPALRLLLVAADTPAGLGFDPETHDQSKIAADHGQLAFEAVASGDMEGAHKHAEHVINIIVGEAGTAEQFGIAFGDHNGDGEAQNPGDGYGVWPAADNAISQIDLLIESPDVTDRIGENARLARQCLVNVKNFEEQALIHAQTLLAVSGTAEAQTPTQLLRDVTAAALNGVDANGDGTIGFELGECGAVQAYQLGHEISAIVLEAAAP